ncbi:putative disease resistance protein RGA4 [Beta vulgaris subsp. vulgaris]|uniref:putative disease resistance protein RGA4 n=1 Tax=Beta vulgaris subsp. vulgaris TaxID=3555 RepID=UPI002036B06A|nr:putative disease resistance protein RGA4 [Beta vulgaris subsp. vulgaris]
MESFDVRHLSLDLEKKLLDEGDAIARSLGGMETLNKLTRTLGGITEKLARAEDVLEVRGGVLNQKWKNKLIHWLCRLEFLIEEIKAFLQGKLPKPLINSFLGSTVDFKDEAKAISDGLSSSMKDNVAEDLVVVSEVFIGRQNELDAVKKMLFDSNNHLSVIPIVGVNGIGKTAFTRLLYKDDKVISHFKVRHWVSMSGISRPRQILEKILKLNSASRDLLSQFHSRVDSRCCLLVLDGVTQAGIGSFLNEMLCNVERGSKVIVTASNEQVSDNLRPLPIVVGAPYILEGLSGTDSKALVERAVTCDLPDIGLEICNKCGNVPRAIWTLAALLTPACTLDKWKSFQDVVLTSVEYPVRTILLKLNLDSYKQLSPSIRQCFNYCSLFPKDYIFSKTELIHLWMAQGFTKSSAQEKRSQELIGDECFRELQNWECFNEDGASEGNGAAVSFRMHHLAKEFVKHAAKDHYYLGDNSSDVVSTDIIRHVSFVVDSSWEDPQWLSRAKNLQSLLLFPSKSCDEYISLPNITEILSNIEGLRSLDLATVNCEGLQDIFRILKHLRYLRLGVSSHSLSESITTLEYLQTLDLRYSGVRYLPSDFYKLANLRHLYTGDRMIDLPPRFGKLTSLRTLDVFIVGENNGSDALAHLSGVGAAGKLKIRYERGYGKHKFEATAGILKDTDLSDLWLTWSSWDGELSVDVKPEKDDTPLQCLQPPPTLESLTVWHWRGMTFPQWGMDVSPSLLPHLASIDIVGCSNCQCLPAFSALPCLRSLKLRGLNALKYIENVDKGNTISAAVTEYFPSLKYLMLANLPELEGWSRADDDDSDRQELGRKQVLSCLSDLRISGCPKLISVPPAQKLKSLEADNIQAQLLKNILHAHESLASSSNSSASFSLKTLQITSINELDSLAINLSSLEHLMIRRCQQLVNLVAESTALLRRLEIHECCNLKDISSALQHLSVLEELEVERCDELDWGNRVAWQGLKNIRSLKLKNMSRLESIPEGFDCLSTLQNLSLCWLHNLNDIPESIRLLTQLRELVIQYCPMLTALPEGLGLLSTLQQLEIRHCPRMTNFIARFPESLQRLQIRECSRLKDISGALQSLSVLEELDIERCEQLDWRDVSQGQVDVDLSLENGTAWQSLKCLRSLKLTSISNLQKLPGSLGCLTMLQKLSLCSLYNFKSLPDWIMDLTQLRHLAIWCCPQLMELPAAFDRLSNLKQLEIGECSELVKKCQKPDGQYWPLIQHVPHIQLE